MKVQQMMIIYEIEPEAEHYSDNKCPSYEKETSKKNVGEKIPSHGPRTQVRERVQSVNNRGNEV